MILLFKRVIFLKNTSSFSFSPLFYSGAPNLGKIYADVSGEIVTSLSVLDHRGKHEVEGRVHFLFPVSVLWGKF